MTGAPALTLILTAGPEDAAGVAHTLAALASLEGALDILIIDHGADAETRALLAAPDDPRLRVLHMAPAPRGAARNRGLAHARGDRVCVLAPGDTLAPFALPLMAGSTADCLFLPAVLRRQDGTLAPVAGAVFDTLADTLAHADTTHPQFATLLRRLALLPAHPALRVVSRRLARDHALAFAHDTDSGWLFATGALMNADSLALAVLPCAAISDAAQGHDCSGFAALSDAAQALHLFARARHFHDPELRMALLGAILGDLRAIADTLTGEDREAFEQGCALMLARSDARLRGAFSAPMRARSETALAKDAPWLPAALDFAQSAYALSEPPASDPPPRQPRQSAIARLAAWSWGQSGGGSSGR